ncbi:MAG: histidine phosphotransferase family protein [Phenylobacterium sp.]|uniref:histidine phosphotransferase ChpT n=1 Tax=Phenylobacterium sp. TaxID=1871053 RepID=UPI0027362308|nr:histidine phosphotransferase family protein [Phenylobacterium sp.]MDP3175368.1 histidine phosphotransferase family protein [Phenylobacterium sp.]
MTDLTPAAALNDAALRPAELAAHLAARLCHDLISPASAIVSGLDLLDDPSAQDMRQEAMELIGSSARKLSQLLAFCRVAFGASSSAAVFDSRELETLAQGVFAHVRADLEWKVEPAGLNKPAARAVLNLAQLGGAALPTGGTTLVRVAQEGEVVAIAVEATGPRARLRPEVLAGLRGEMMGEGLHGHWVQAYYLHQLLTDAGGRVFADVGDDKVTFAATLPA